MYTIIYYQTARRDKPVKVFLDDLGPKAQKKVYARLVLLSEEGPQLLRPYADHVKGKLYELRIQFARDNVRVLYFFFQKDSIVLLHGFLKKQWQIPPGDLSLAERRMQDWIGRHP